MIRLE